MSCAHPADVLCTACDGYPRIEDMTPRQREIANLDARIFGLNVYGKTEEDRAEARRLHDRLQALRAEERTR